MAPPAVPNTLLNYAFLKRNRCIDDLAPLSETKTVKEHAKSSLRAPRLAEPLSHQDTAKGPHESSANSSWTHEPMTTNPQPAIDRHDPASTAKFAVQDGVLVQCAVHSPEEMLQSFHKYISNADASLVQAIGDFLDRLQQHQQADYSSGMDSIRHLVSEFRATEPQLADRPLEDLTTFSGHLRTPIGVILHYPTYRKSVDELFDAENPTLSMLMDKGLSRDNVFGYDWHWRRFDPRDSPSACPLSKLSSVARNAHNTLSSTILGVAPMPLLLVFGNCAKRSYIAAAGKLSSFVIKLRTGPSPYSTGLVPDGSFVSQDPAEFKALTVEQWGAPEELEFFLESASNGSIRRIIFFALHPCITCMGRDITETFRRLYPSRGTGGGSGIRPVADLDMEAYTAVREEDDERRMLAHGSIPSFTPQSWVKRSQELLAVEVQSGNVLGYNDLPMWFTKTVKQFRSIDPVALEESGLSIINAVIHCFSSRSSAIQQARKTEPSAAQAYITHVAPKLRPNGQKWRKWWHGKQIVQSAKGEVTLWYQEGNLWERITFWAKGKGTRSSGSTETLTIHFVSCGIILKGPRAAGEPTRWSKSVEEFRKLKDGSARLLRAHARELQHQKEAAFEEAAKGYGKENVDPHSTM